MQVKNKKYKFIFNILYIIKFLLGLRTKIERKRRKPDKSRKRQKGVILLRYGNEKREKKIIRIIIQRCQNTKYNKFRKANERWHRASIKII